METAIVVPTFNRPENIERLLYESDIPKDTLVVVSSASNADNTVKEKEVLKRFPRHRTLYVPQSNYDDIARAVMETTGDPEVGKVLNNNGYGIGRNIGYLALMMRKELTGESHDVILTIDDDHVLPKGYVDNMRKAMTKTVPQIRRDVLPKREVFFSGDQTKPVKALVGYYLWLEHLGFLETSLPDIEKTAQTPGASPSAIRRKIDMLNGYSLDPFETYYNDSKAGEVLLSEISVCPMFTETKKTYFGGGNYAFAGELLPDMTFKGPMPGRTRYVDDQLLFFGIFPELAKSKGGIAIWGNCAEFANLHYPAKRDAISGIESDLDGRIALSVLRQDFEPASDDASLSENFSRIASNFRAGAYDDSANRQREEYVARLRRLGTRFTELPAAIRRSASAYPPGYASKFETHALDAEKFMERYMGEAERIAAKEFDREKPAQLYANLSMQYALREKIVRSVPKVAGKMAKYLATSPD